MSRLANIALNGYVFKLSLLHTSYCVKLTVHESRTSVCVCESHKDAQVLLASSVAKGLQTRLVTNFRTPMCVIGYIIHLWILLEVKQVNCTACCYTTGLSVSIHLNYVCSLWLNLYLSSLGLSKYFELLRLTLHANMVVHFQFSDFNAALTSALSPSPSASLPCACGQPP